MGGWRCLWPGPEMFYTFISLSVEDSPLDVEDGVEGLEVK